MEALSFDDVLLVPQHSDILSRSEVKLNIDVPFGKDIVELKTPIISANMPSVTEPNMARAMWIAGGFGVLHRFNTIPMAETQYVDVLYSHHDCGVSLGLKDYKERSYRLFGAGARLFFVDVAHGDHHEVLRLIEWIRGEYEDYINIAAGNVVTGEGALRLVAAGADIIKVGVGPGAACTTREVTGFGYPQLSAIENVRSAVDESTIVIADGGIKNSGDIVKALAWGADLVMVGKLLAGTDESPSPGEYWGNASHRMNGHNAPEGVEGTVERTGTVEEVIKNLTWGIKSGLSYAGARNVQELRDKVEYVVVSPQTMTETRARI